MADRVMCEEIVVKGKRVVELGAGSGLPSLCSAFMGAAKVCILWDR